MYNNCLFVHLFYFEYHPYLSQKQIKGTLYKKLWSNIQNREKTEKDAARLSEVFQECLKVEQGLAHEFPWLVSSRF